jgi:hypothetical protein
MLRMKMWDARMDGRSDVRMEGWTDGRTETITIKKGH